MLHQPSCQFYRVNYLVIRDPVLRKLAEDVAQDLGGVYALDPLLVTHLLRICRTVVIAVFALGLNCSTHFFCSDRLVSESFYCGGDMSYGCGIQEIVLVHASWQENCQVLASLLDVLQLLFGATFRVEDEAYSWRN